MASRFFAPAITFGQPPAPSALVDPFRLLQQGLDNVLTDIARGAGQADASGAGELLAGPRIDVEENDKEIRLTAELPGVTEDDVQVTLDGDLLVIAGEKKQEQERNEGDLRIIERAFGRFRRALRLPFAPDPEKVQASFKDGVLAIAVPKETEQRQRKRQIPVSRKTDRSGAAEASLPQESSGSAATQAPQPQDSAESAAADNREPAKAAAD